jgi:hypothetical protein
MKADNFFIGGFLRGWEKVQERVFAHTMPTNKICGDFYFLSRSARRFGAGIEFPAGCSFAFASRLTGHHQYGYVMPLLYLVRV